MAAPSRRSFADWEKEAARQCIYCGRRVLNKDASGTHWNDVTGIVTAWHEECRFDMRKALR